MSPPPNQLWGLFLLVDTTSDPEFDTGMTIMDTLPNLRKRWDLAKAMKNGAKLLTPSDLRKHMARATCEEQRYQEEQRRRES